MQVVNLCCAERSLSPSLQSAPLLQRCSVVCKTAFLQSICMYRSFVINLYFSSKFSLVKAQYMHHHTELCVPVAVVAPSARSCTGMRLFSCKTTPLCLQQNGSNEKTELRQFQFMAWPDHGVPEYPTPILAFLRRVKACNPTDAGPMVVHCR